jgi:hypothetical protein
MIDEEWLRELRLATPDGSIEELLGVGTEWVVFRLVRPDGQEVAYSLRRNHLGFNIREVSHLLTDEPGYDLGRVNAKLLRLMSDPAVDSCITPYDRLYGKVFYLLATQGMKELIARARADMGSSAAEAIPFILGTKGISRRLAEMASLDAGDADGQDLVTVNGPYFPVQGRRDKLAAAGRALTEFLAEFLERIARSGIPDPVTRTELFEANPLYVWGGAVMDGFFTDAELPAAVDFINDKIGRLPSHEFVVAYLQQAMLLGHLLAFFAGTAQFPRFVKLAAELGLLFRVTGPDGAVAADGGSMLRARTDLPSLHAQLRR